MNDSFAENIAARLRDFVNAQSEPITQEDYTASLAPLHTRLQKLLDSLPASEQRKGLSILDLQARLRGRKGGLPHIGELGAAIRRLGWQRRRRWSNEDAAFASLWYPKDQC